MNKSIELDPGQQASGMDTARPSPAQETSSTANERKAVVPDHELLRVIGQGAYGDVWLARNILGEYRAVKVVWRRDFSGDNRPFEREFEGIKRFEPISRSHPSQLAILHVGKNDQAGYFYYVMELADDAAVKPNAETRNPEEHRGSKPELAAQTAQIQSSDSGCRPTFGLQNSDLYVPKTLRRIMRDGGPLPAAKCLEIARSLAGALAHLHGQGLVHRDVKPSNVIFVRGVPKLADIGLVTGADEARSFVGTEGYVPPEGPVAASADCYALGKVLYELSTGHDRTAWPEPAADLGTRPDRQLLLELNAILHGACARDPRHRYLNGAAMLADLDRLCSGKSVQRVLRVERRRRTARRAGLLLMLATALFGLTMMVRRIQGPHPLTPVERRSTNQSANRFYDLGRFYFDQTTGRDFQTAAQYFEQALQADPQFAQAHAWLALTYAWKMNDEWNANWKFHPKAKAAALRALELDGSLAEPHLALGWYKAVTDWAWRDADAEYKTALRANPSAYVAHYFYAEFLRVTGRADEALQEIKQAYNLNPRSIVINGRWVDALVAARRFQEAITQADQAIAMQPSAPKAEHHFRIRALCALGRFPEAIEAERNLRLLDGEVPENVAREFADLNNNYSTHGSKAYWERELQLSKGPFWKARACAQLGQTDEAIAQLQLALKTRDVWLIFYVMTDWTLDPVRSKREFRDILRSMHFE